jgi:uncharacterized protein (TIGR03083 family)
MEIARYRECLASEFGTLRAAVAGADPQRPVPTCPGWSMADLVGHVAEVYLHKVECMRRGEFPEPWPPERPAEPPLALLDRAYAQLTIEFDARRPSEATAHWYEPDPTVGCLVRRMAQETVVHRVDAQRAAGTEVTPVAADLARDGVDEALLVVLGFLSRTWPEAFDDLPRSGESPPVRIVADDTPWLLTPTPKGVLVTIDGTAGAAATVAGDARDMLLWLWGRVDDTAVAASGDPAALSQLRGLLREATQ